MASSASERNRLITHRELEVGDNVDLDFADGGWSMAKVTSIRDGIVTLFRPWMDSNDDYPRIGVEVFTVFHDSSKTMRLFSRRDPS